MTATKQIFGYWQATNGWYYREKEHIIKYLATLGRRGCKTEKHLIHGIIFLPEQAAKFNSL